MPRKNIKVDEDLFARLKEDKGKHRSWPQYFEDQLAEDTDAVDYAEIERRCERAVEATLSER